MDYAEYIRQNIENRDEEDNNLKGEDCYGILDECSTLFREISKLCPRRYNYV